MASLKLLLSQARRHCFTNHPSHFHSPLSHPFRSFSSSSESNPLFQQPIPIQPVSYPVKPQDPPPPEPEPQPSSDTQPPPPPPQASNTPIPEQPRAWTREDIRYVKDAPSITPVSYPVRVAPLPDDKAPVDVDAMETERRKIEAEDQLRKKMMKSVEDEKMKVPFPLFIKPKQKEKPPLFDLSEAIRQVKANAKAKFDETVEAHVRLGIDSKRTELAVRGTVILPHGAPKAVTVAVFAEGAEAEEAKAAGADIVGGKELIEEIASGNNKLKVDKCFSTPGMAPHLGKIAQYLRKRRLMPDKKLGTLTSDIAGQLKELRQGRIEFKMESKSILHVGVGKVSYKEENLRENIGAFMNAVLQAKPAGLKKTSKYAGYVLSVHICSTIGPGIPVSIQSLSKAADNYKKAHMV
uniref:Large ribosomal subunit protein uL1c n=1 Tax=Medicago truncatula TaxID=3880 RepID=I3SL79_MEDTR|nr:unknown [Medicago truncatula]